MYVQILDIFRKKKSSFIILRIWIWIMESLSSGYRKDIRGDQFQR